VPRTQPGAVHDQVDVVTAQAVTLAGTGRFDTLCLHGDTPGAVDLARRVRDALEASGVRVEAFA
jgi:UPF0271 protein